MTEFLVFLAIITGIGLLLRYLRKREIEAFRDADISVFEEFVKTKPIDKKTPETNAVENIVNLPLTVKPEVTYQLKAHLFDEVLQSFLINLTKVVGDRFLIFTKVPLQEFVHIEGASDMLLAGKTVSLILCERSTMNIACGIDLRESGMNAVKQSEMLQDVFQQIQRPLFQFPFVNNISVAEISEKISPILASSPLSRNCPKCGREMVMRKAVKGRNAGKTFWVCREFPSCKGISRIGKF